MLACLLAQGCGKDACEDQAAEVQVDIQLSGIAPASISKTVVTISINSGKEMTKTFHKAQPSFVFNLDYPQYNSAPFSFFVRAIAYNKADKELGYGETLNNFSFNGCNRFTVTVQTRSAKDAGADVGLDASTKDSAPDKSRDLPVKDIAAADKAVPDKTPLVDMTPSEAIPDGPVVDKSVVPDKAVAPDKTVPDAPVPDQIQPDYPVPDMPLPDMPPPADSHVPDQLHPDLPTPPDAGPVVPLFPVAVAGSKSNMISAVDVDKSGYVYITGCWQGTATIAGKTLTAKGNGEMFTAKLSPSGAPIWVVTAGGTGASACGQDISVDESGNVHVSGYFYGTVTFGSHTETAAGQGDLFVGKLDSAGNYTWLFTAKNNGFITGKEIAMGPQGDVYVAGYYQNTATFGSNTLQSKGGWDLFVAKLSSAGKLLWVTSGGDVKSEELGGLAVDESGNAHITGWFLGNTTLGSFALSSSAAQDLFVARISSTGKFLWANATSGSYFARGWDIAVDSGGNSYITGTFGGNATFGTQTLSGDTGDVFVSKLDANGSFIWTVPFKGSAGSASDIGRAIRVNRAGQIIIGGQFGYITSGPGETLTLDGNVLTSKGSVDVFLALLDPQGKALWAISGGGTDREYLHGLAFSSDGNLFSSGTFKLTAMFGSKTLVSQGLEDGFLWKELPSSQWCNNPPVVKSCSAGLCKVPAGCFYMGSPTTEPCRDQNTSIKETLHSVTLTKSFVIGDQEVTQGEYQSLLTANPSYFTACGVNCPVESVTWHMAAAYCNALSNKEGLIQCYSCSGSGSSTACSTKSGYAGSKINECGGYRLPTEAEWEYAYRAGSKTAFYNGPYTTSFCVGMFSEPNLDKIGWYYANGGSTTHAAKGKMPNAYGLYDMPGNVLEWTNDWFQADLSSSSATDPAGAMTGTNKTAKNGAAPNSAASMRAARRLSAVPTKVSPWFGFRCVRSEQEWEVMKSPSTEDLRGVWGTADNNVYAVGQHGTILHFDGTAWKSQTSGATTTLSGVWGSGASNV